MPRIEPEPTDSIKRSIFSKDHLIIMNIYNLELDHLLDLYKSADWRLAEALKSMREQSQNGFMIIIQRTFDNAPPEELFRLKNINEVNAWVLKAFPKRIFYQFANVKRNTLDFVLIKSSEQIGKYSVDLKKNHNNNRIVIVGKDSNGLAVLTGTEHDINNFSGQENFDDLDWTTAFITDTNQPFA